MSKIYMLLYMNGAIGGVWGPLPYDINECHIRMQENNSKIQEFKVKRHSKNDLYFSCEMKDNAPKVSKDVHDYDNLKEKDLSDEK